MPGTSTSRWAGVLTAVPTASTSDERPAERSSRHNVDASSGATAANTSIPTETRPSAGGRPTGWRNSSLGGAQGQDHRRLPVHAQGALAAPSCRDEVECAHGRSHPRAAHRHEEGGGQRQHGPLRTSSPEGVPVRRRGLGSPRRQPGQEGQGREAPGGRGGTTHRRGGGPHPEGGRTTTQRRPLERRSLPRTPAGRGAWPEVGRPDPRSRDRGRTPLPSPRDGPPRLRDRRRRRAHVLDQAGRSLP